MCKKVLINVLGKLPNYLRMCYLEETSVDVLVQRYKKGKGNSSICMHTQYMGAGL